jgi:hypothetical protein
MSTPAILSALIDTGAHPDLARVTSVDGVAVVPAPLAPASFVLVCADGAVLAVRYLDAGDLLHSIRSGRLDAELVDLKRRSAWAYLLIGGQMTPDRDGRVRHGDAATGWAWDAYQGALLTAQEIGIGVLTLRHADDAGDALARLARRARGPKRARPVREALFVDPATDLLMSLPGIGETTADQLLSYTGGGAWALAALTSETMQTPGIGPKTRATIRRVLGLAEGEALIPTVEKVLPLNEQADLLQRGSIPVATKRAA